MEQKKPYIFALLAILLWSTVATAFKLSLSYLSPLLLVWISSGISLIFFSAVLIYTKKYRELFTISWKVLIFLALLGAISPFAYYLVLFKAYNLLPAQEAQALNYTWALTLTYLSVFILKQKLNWYDFVAGIVCYMGVLFIATRGNIFTLSFENSYGVFLALLSTLFWALYWIYNTKLKVDPILTLFVNFLFGFFLITIFVVVNNSWEEICLKGFLYASYVGLFEMGITFMLWLKALQLIDKTSNIANLIFLSPFLSLIFIYFLLGEKILPSTIIGLILIVSGLMLQQYYKKRKKYLN